MDAAQTSTARLTASDGSGNWISPDQLWTSALAIAREGGDVNVPLDGLEHLDASALQILLALAAELRRTGHNLELAGPQAALERWFEIAGAAALLRPASATPTNAEVA